MKHGIIYKITNKINNKVYIGKTVQKFTKRVRKFNYKSCTALNNSIKVHGWDNFEKEEFICALDESYLAELEEITIKHFDCIAPKGYNIIKIDNGLNSYTEETRNKIRESRAKYLAKRGKVVAPNRKQHSIINGVAHKECTGCKEMVSLDNYNKFSQRWDGLDVYCKPCSRSVRKREYKKMSEDDFKKSYENRQDPEKQKEMYENNPALRRQRALERSKPIIATSVETSQELEFESAKYAKQYGFDNTSIGRAIKNNTVYKKHTWRFKND